MTFKEIQELIKLINRSNLTEFKLKDKEFELTIKTNKQDKTKTVVQQIPSVAAASPVMPMPAVQQPVAPAASAPAASKAAPAAPAAEKVEDESKYLAIKSPIVGTFYRSSSPEKGPYVKVGDKVEVNQVVCIVEAMKLFNEIESEIRGTIVKVMVEDAQPVEYDQVLFLVDPS